ncbi:MAG: hypothetical protein IKM18_00405 [Clostridia bacterium]|nr:hypothetical protein [Clostridia bacterium]MBR3714350.1 hypothetical protein [Clostridia bacterium]
MNKKSDVLLYVGIPLIVEICLGFGFVIAGALEIPTNRGIVYTTLLSISIFGSLLVPVPCSISSILGIKKAVKLRKHDEKNTGLPILIGTVNIVVSLVVFAFWLYVIFVVGPSA